MSGFGVSAIVITTVIVAICLTTIGLGTWSVISHRRRKQNNPNDDEENHLNPMPSPSTSAFFPTNVATAPSPSPSLASKSAPSPTLTESYLTSQVPNQSTPHARKFSFDKNSIDGLEEIDIAEPSATHMGHEQLDPLVARPERAASKTPRWV